MTVMIEQAPGQVDSAPITAPVEPVPVESVPVESVAVEPAPRPSPPKRVPKLPPRLVFTPRLARAVGWGSFLAFWIGMLIQPAPTGAHPVMNVWADLVANGTMIVLLASWLMLAAGRRSGLRLSAIAGAGLIVQTAMCPAFDHHEIAPWWFAQLAISIGIAAVGAVLFRRTRPVRR